MEPKIMMPILFFLLTIIVLGTVLYVYLRQEQNKVIAPKDKYDEAWKKAQTTSYPIWATWTPRNRVFILLYTFCAFGLAPIFFWLFIAIISSSGNGAGNGASIIGNLLSAIAGILIMLALSPLSLPIFPIGLSKFIMPEVGLEYSFIIGYIPYIIIFLTSFFVNNRRVFTFIYLIFIMLLIMNIIGCTKIDIDLSGLS